MMIFNSFYLKTLKYELCNKFAYKNINEVPKLKKIILNFGCKTADLKHLSASLLALELITSQKGRITTTKSPNLLLKIKKGNPSGCKVTLKKTQMSNTKFNIIFFSFGTSLMFLYANLLHSSYFKVLR
jgi:large subunit ribosomal protein L5